MTNVADSFEENLTNIFDGIRGHARKELELIRDPAELERFWFWFYDEKGSLAWNIYQFVDMLQLYRRKCREWEEMHNGTACVVERVRDRYLFPKIKEFADIIRAIEPNHVRIPSSREEAELMILVSERYLNELNITESNLNASMTKGNDHA